MFVLIYLLVLRGLLAPLIGSVVIISLAVTPRPFLCLHKEKGKEMHLLRRRTSNIVFNPACAGFHNSRGGACPHLVKKDNALSDLVAVYIFFVLSEQV